MNEEFYLALIEELTRVKDIGGAIIETKTFKFNDKDITYSVEMQRIDDIRVRINKTILVYNNGIYSSVDTAIYAGENLTDLHDKAYHYSPDVDKDIKETVDNAVAEFYKYIQKI